LECSEFVLFDIRRDVQRILQYVFRHRGVMHCRHNNILPYIRYPFSDTVHGYMQSDANDLRRVQIGQPQITW